MTDKELIKQEDNLEEAARYYLLNNHVSPLNDMLHQADLKVEMQYHKDIEDAYKADAHWQHGKDFDDLLQSEMKFPKEFYERGKADMREEMMKDAVEGKITLDINGDIRMDCADVFHVGDRLKIIIVKTEQQ